MNDIRTIIAGLLLAEARQQDEALRRILHTRERRPFHAVIRRFRRCEERANALVEENARALVEHETLAKALAEENERRSV